MASPQKENGFAPIANEILEALSKTKFIMSSYEWRIIMFLFRQTYGWHTPQKEISLSNFVVGTKIKKSHVCREIKKLVIKNIVTQLGNGYNVKYSFQKNYDLWKPLPNQVIVTKLGNLPLPNQDNTLKINKYIYSTSKSSVKTKLLSPQAAFAPPSLDEAKEYFKTIGLNDFEAEYFCNYHGSRGWMIGKQKMKDWKAASRTWKMNHIKYAKESPNGATKTPRRIVQ